MSWVRWASHDSWVVQWRLPPGQWHCRQRISPIIWLVRSSVSLPLPTSIYLSIYLSVYTYMYIDKTYPSYSFHQGKGKARLPWLDQDTTKWAHGFCPHHFPSKSEQIKDHLQRRLLTSGDVMIIWWSFIYPSFILHSLLLFVQLPRIIIYPWPSPYVMLLLMFPCFFSPSSPNFVLSLGLRVRNA